MRFDIRRISTTTSTNDDAKQAAEAGAAEGLAIWALQQNSGRGRQGRVWESPEGNLYCSVLLRPVVERRDYGKFSFVAALAVWDVVSAVLSSSFSIELKYPNDVLVNGKKISGILLESGEGWLVVGVGLNVQHMPENPLYPVTSLAAEISEPPPLDVLLDKFLNALAYWNNIFTAQGFAPVRTAWLSRARKGAMRVRLPQEEIHGEFVDLDAEGNLRLLLPDGTERSISAGDVYFG